MTKIVVEEDQEMELTKVDGNLEILDGATVIVSPNVEYLAVSGDLISKGDVVIQGSIVAGGLRHKNGYLEIEGDAKVKEISVSSGKMRNGSKLIVYGNLEGIEAEIDGSLEVEKDFICKDVDIMGSCKIHGEATVEEYEVSGSAKHGKDLKAKEVEVNGSLKASQSVFVEEDFEISGSAKISDTLKAVSVNVGGSFVCSTLTATEVDVGGSVKITRGEIEEKIDVGGSFKCEESLRVPKASCNGSCRFGDNSQVNVLNINGATKVGSDFVFQTIKVNGAFNFDTNASGDTLTINGATQGEGLLKLNEKLSINGALHVDKVEADEVDIAGSFDGEEIKARFIHVSRNSRVKGTLIAEKVIVEDEARVENIIADDVELGEKVKALKVQAKNLNADPSAKYRTE